MSRNDNNVRSEPSLQSITLPKDPCATTAERMVLWLEAWLHIACLDPDVVLDVIGFMNNFTGERMVHLLDLFGPLVDVENVRQEQLGEVMDGLRR